MFNKFIITALFMIFLALFLGCQQDGKTAKDPHDHGKTVAAEQKYYCPMHPEVVSDKPSTCPICFMALVPEQAENSVKNIKDQLTIDPNRQQLAGVTTEKAQIRTLNAETEAFGIVELAENQKTIISARFNGRVEELYADQTGLKIKAGQPLFKFYSQDVLAVQNEYLQLFRNYPDNPNLLDPVRTRLGLFGLNTQQISDLEKNGKANPVIEYYSPVSGLILDKKIVAGQYFNEGSTLYEITGLNPIWVTAEVALIDAQSIKNGQKMSLYPENNPMESYEGTVIYKNPVVSKDSRLIKIRLSVKNPSENLFAGAYIKVLIPRQFNSGVTVPEESVLFTGKRTVVWLKTDSTSFKSVDVEIGGKAEGYYLITSGISEGAEIVKNGAYLLDSESSLKNGK